MKSKVSPLDLMARARAKLKNAEYIESQALSKLERAEKLMEEAMIKFSNAKHSEEVSALRSRRLNNAYVKLNKSRQLIEARAKRQAEHDIFIREDIAQM